MNAQKYEKNSFHAIVRYFFYKKRSIFDEFITYATVIFYKDEISS